MKKILLFAAAVSVAAFSANADEGLVNISKRCADAGLEKNFVVNGNFEDPGYTQEAELAYSWIEGQYEASEIPGWTLSTGGKWNGLCMIGEQDPDDYMIFEGNKQFLHMYNYRANGWTRVKIYQTIEGLTPGKTYRLDLYVAHLYPNSLDWANPDQGFCLYGAPLPGEDKGALIVEVNSISEDSEYEYYIYDFTATEDTMQLELWCQNYNGEGNESGDHWVDWDEVRIYDESACDYNAENPGSGIESIASEAGVTAIYTLQGVQVPANSKLNGVYIVKQGNKVMKAVY